MAQEVWLKFTPHFRKSLSSGQSWESQQVQPFRVCKKKDLIIAKRVLKR